MTEYQAEILVFACSTFQIFAAVIFVVLGFAFSKRKIQYFNKLTLAFLFLGLIGITTKSVFLDRPLFTTIVLIYIGIAEIVLYFCFKRKIEKELALQQVAHQGFTTMIERGTHTDVKALLNIQPSEEKKQ